MKHLIYGLIALAALAAPSLQAQHKAYVPSAAGCAGGGCAAGGCAAAPAAAPCGGGCDRCDRGPLLSRLGAWFCYKDRGRCGGQPCCATPCSTPLYLYFFRDCAYQPSACGHPGVEATVNGPYRHSVFPVGHMVGGLPTGINGPCCR